VHLSLIQAASQVQDTGGGSYLTRLYAVSQAHSFMRYLALGAVTGPAPEIIRSLGCSDGALARAGLNLLLQSINHWYICSNDIYRKPMPAIN
jgi:hypothetical protein